MVPYIFGRLKGKKLLVDPLFADLLDSNFSNEVVKTEKRNQENATDLKLALPRPWEKDSLSSLAPFDLLFHYTVNSLRPLLGLEANATYQVRVIDLLGLTTSFWKLAYNLRFNPSLFIPPVRTQLFQLMLVNKLPDLPFLLTIFQCLH